ncbi:unnamed protein product [Toxocara canis]|uniref:Methyl-accepting chemotaxis protein n=1 Tax=Toxocara canis TaxID=6265 RepID=A0A183U2R4_TOXCA|nr:unnamed protein product [Toxocara canis]
MKDLGWKMAKLADFEPVKQQMVMDASGESANFYTRIETVQKTKRASEARSFVAKNRIFSLSALIFVIDALATQSGLCVCSVARREPRV